jgi:hypothetical protein
MSRNIIFVLMYNCHKLLYFIYHFWLRLDVGSLFTFFLLLESLYCLLVGNVVDVPKAYTASIFRVEVIRGRRRSCIYTRTYWFNKLINSTLKMKTYVRNVGYTTHNHAIQKSKSIPNLIIMTLNPKC